MKSNTGRSRWIDIAKGLGIFVIVLGHSCAQTDYFALVTYSFNSVTFFVLAGLTFCSRMNKDKSVIIFDDRDWSVFLRNILCSLIIPYLIWAIISIFIYRLIGNFTISTLRSDKGNIGILQNLVGMLYGNSQTGYFNWNRPLWFIVCLVCVEIIWFFILKQYKKMNRLSQICTSISVILFSFIWMIVLAINKIYLRLPWEVETAISMISFFGIGLIIKSTGFVEAIQRKKHITLLCIFLLVLANVTIAIFNGPTDLRSDYYANVFLYITGALCGCFALIMISILIKHNTVIEYVGRRTLPILVMNKFPIMLFRIILEKLGFPNNYISAIIITFISLALCITVERITSKYFPYMFGIKSGLSEGRVVNGK